MKRFVSIGIILAAALIFLAGCGVAPSTTATVQIQLIKAGDSTNYAVDNMTISIQKDGGAGVLTGVTNAGGQANITVTETGTYNVIKVDGLDATNLAVGDEGREFAKTSPLADPYPNLSYSFSGSIPSVDVTSLGSNYPVNVPVPTIIKVTVLAVGSENAASSTSISAGTAPFAGRVMVSNITCSDSHAGIAVWSSDINSNRLHVYANISGGNPQIIQIGFYNSGGGTDLGSVSNYTQAGPIYFEAPGTDGGDWALGCALSSTNLKTREELGGEDATRNFPNIKSDEVIHIWSTAGGSGWTYQLDYRIFEFNTL